MTVNVSTGGVYFETTAGDFLVGDKLSIDLGVPQDDERFPKESKISTAGAVIRVQAIDDEPNAEGITFARYGIAAKFERGFKLTF